MKTTFFSGCHGRCGNSPFQEEEGGVQVCERSFGNLIRDASRHEVKALT